jgi:hypothetical protein
MGIIKCKTFAYSNKSQKLHFSVTFPVITFYAGRFYNFFNGFKISIRFWFLRPTAFMINRVATKRLKKTKNIFCKCVLELNFATINVHGEPSC